MHKKYDLRVKHKNKGETKDQQKNQRLKRKKTSKSKVKYVEKLEY